MAKDTGTVNIHGKEYKTVASRVQEFREKYKGGDNNLPILSIETEIVERTANEVVMKATIKTAPGGTILATGYAEEQRTSSQINKTSALENAETSAIGRALASFGLAGTEFASADEVAQAITQQGEPAGRALQPPIEGTTSSAPTNGTEATAKQLGFIKANFAKLGITEREDMLANVTGVIGREVQSSTELTKAEAKRVIDKQLANIDDAGGE